MTEAGDGVPRTDGAGLAVRWAAPDDVPAIYALVKALAAYEREPDAVTGTEQQLAHWLFGGAPACEALVAELAGETVGFALFFTTFSTWEVEPGLWLEDLFVPEQHRRHGVGRALLSRLAAITIERGYARLEWTALDWNTPALTFYAGLGAERMEEWTTHRLVGDTLRELAGDD